jgi:hypothetical protein
LAASTIALNQDLCRGRSVIIFFIRKVFGKFYVFHCAFNQEFVFAASQQVSRMGVDYIVRDSDA